MSKISWLNLPGYRPGETLNISSGCRHDCRWVFGKRTVRCYARSFANRFRAYYPNGFDAYYWNEKRLEIPGKVTEPTGWFLDSMGDLFGAWVPKAHTQQVLDMCRAASWHTFFILTKDPGRLPLFDYPPNVLLGFSSPPDHFKGHWLTQAQKTDYVLRGLEALRRTNATVLWMSVEPFSFNIARLLEKAGLHWFVAGGASGGKQPLQPPDNWVCELVDVADRQGTPVFFKENLWYKPRRTAWPIAVLERARILAGIR